MVNYYSNVATALCGDTGMVLSVFKGEGHDEPAASLGPLGMALSGPARRSRRLADGGPL